MILLHKIETTQNRGIKKRGLTVFVKSKIQIIHFEMIFVEFLGEI